MTGEIIHLVFALILLVGGHFLMSHPLRSPLVKAMGETIFRLIYSLVAGLGLVWTIIAYRAAPQIELWPQLECLRPAVNLVMLAASILMAGSFVTSNPYTKLYASSPGNVPKVSGVFAITRHPLMWAFALWALSHLVLNGDLATLILTASVAVLALVGAHFQDAKLVEKHGVHWQGFEQATSYWPFVALFKGQQRWTSIGIWPVITGFGLYIILLAAHLWLGGVSAGPW
ncbi:MAG: NnrU family protein [Sphingomonadales bacterium]|jgi:uncharacterized membrane protein